jgi:hypothetical protein
VVISLETSSLYTVISSLGKGILSSCWSEEKLLDQQYFVKAGFPRETAAKPLSLVKLLILPITLTPN